MVGRLVAGVRRLPAGTWDVAAAVAGLTLVTLGTWQVAGGGVACLVLGAILLVGAAWPTRRG